MGKKSSKRKPTEAVRFTCEAADVDSVFVAGTFNDWNPEEFPLVRKEKGHWEATLDLKAGRYEYKFVVDGNWVCMPGCEEKCLCPDCVWNEHGSMNRVIEVADASGD